MCGPPGRGKLLEMSNNMDWKLFAVGCLFVLSALCVHLMHGRAFNPRAYFLGFRISNRVAALCLGVLGTLLCYQALPDSESEFSNQPRAVVSVEPLRNQHSPTRQ